MHAFGGVVGGEQCYRRRTGAAADQGDNPRGAQSHEAVQAGDLPGPLL